MKLYLLQHGECESKEINEERPLTKKGRIDIEKLSKLGPFPVSCVFHSGKLRAKQSAEIIAGNSVVKQKNNLAPNDDIQPLLDEIKKSNDDLMIVGHLPFLSKLSSELLAGNQNKPIISFKQGSLLCLERIEDDWIVLFFIIPDV